MNFKLKNIIKKSDGYTMIELILSIAIIGIIATSMISFLSSTSLTFNQIKTRKQLISDSTVGLEMLSQELSHMYNLITTDSKLLRFTCTMDTNLVIGYMLDNDGFLARNEGGGTFQTVTQNVDYGSSQFTYYNESGSIGTPVRRIRLYLLSTLNGVSSPLTIDVSPYIFR